jgi:hypothetical protein
MPSGENEGLSSQVTVLPRFEYTKLLLHWHVSYSSPVFHTALRCRYLMYVVINCDENIELETRDSEGRFVHSTPCPCRAHAFPLPCRAAKALGCVFPILFTQWGRVGFTLAMPCPCRAHAMLWPCRSSQGYGTTRRSWDGLWATCPHSAFSGYHVEFHEDCFQKHTNSPHNDPYLRLQRVVAAHYKKTGTSSSDISGYHADFHEGRGTVGAGQGGDMTCVN